MLYAPVGLGFPYNPGIEQWILKALRRVAGHVVVADPGRPLVSQATSARVQMVLALMGHQVDAPTAQALRRAGIPAVLWATEDPYYADAMVARASLFEQVFTVDSSCVEVYRRAGARRVYHLPLGYDPETFYPGNVPPDYQSDVCMVGVAFRNRLEVVQRLVPHLAGRRLLLVGPHWDRLARPLPSPGATRLAIVPPSEARLYYAGARIVLNIHRRWDDDEINLNRSRVRARSPNNRTFEILACGTLELVDASRPDLALYFTPGEDLAVFDTPEELPGLIERFLSHDEDRRAIAGRGMARVRRHTYVDRLDTLIRTVLGRAP